MSTLVTYFSAEGTTAKVAKEFAEKICAQEHLIGADYPRVYGSKDFD